PMTGDAANYGKLMSQAVRLAAEERNAAGGVAGLNVDVIVEDSEGVPEKGQAAIEKLASVDKVNGIIGPVFSGVGMAIAPRAQAEKIIMISPSSTHADFPGIGNYIFRTVPSDGLQAAVAGAYFAQELGIKKLAVLYVKNDYSQGLYKAVAKIFEANGGKVVAVESALQGDKDFKTQLTRIRSANPDAIYLPNYVAEMAQILEQAASLGITAQFLSADGFSNPEIFELAEDYANGVIYTGPVEAEATPGSQGFEADYMDRWGVAPDSFSKNAYDGANLIMDAAEKVYKDTGSLATEDLRKLIAATEGYQGVSGEVTFAEDGNLIAVLGVFKVENRKPVQTGIYTVDAGKLVKLK
ncbi:MAG: ABC transporter substrate-binding protein, partial [Spirochaetales bacterium]|nr:ABC transporter substrate-binding protein [Spirochaetales bacterium]